MRISNVLKQDKVTISFEVFPPKKADGLEKVKTATEEIAVLKTDFMSVAYGAGGSTSKLTLEIAANLHKRYSVTILPHLTCIASTKEHVAETVQRLNGFGIENIMVLRGDIP